MLPLPHTQIPYNIAIFVVLAVIFGIVLHATATGRSIYAMGASPEAALFAGIRVKRVKTMLYVVSGLVCALAGVLWTFRLATAVQNNGLGLELDVVAIVLLGGVSIFGGKGTLAGVVLAVIAFAGLQNALLLTNFNQEATGIVIGALLLVSVFAPNAGRLRRAGPAPVGPRPERPQSPAVGGGHDQARPGTHPGPAAPTRADPPAAAHDDQDHQQGATARHGTTAAIRVAARHPVTARWPSPAPAVSPSTAGPQHGPQCTAPIERIQSMRRSTKRALWAPAVLLVASATLAACSSSGSGSGSSSAPSASSSSGASASGGLKTGLKVFIVPKNLGNPYFTTADSVKSGGAMAALATLGETATETSGTAATPASQIPAIQAAITKGANALIVSATDPSALCPTLKAAMAKGITVVTYDSDAPTCRNLFVNQASTAQIGDQ